MPLLQDLVDDLWYVIKYADVGAAVFAGGIKSGGHHYNEHGWREGRNPNALFDTNYYLLSNADVRNLSINPLEHFLKYGGLEGRDPSQYFDSSYYLLQNPDVAGGLINPLQHYLLYGGKEGRDPSANFDSSKYLQDNPDVGAAGVNPLQHYLENGKSEGRQAFDTSGNKVVDPIIPTGGDKTGDSPNLKLTPDADVINGGEGNDFLDAPTYTTPEGALRNTASSADFANLGGGFDTARLSLIPVGEAAQGLGVRLTLLNLERLLIRPLEGAPRLDAGAITGLERVEILLGPTGSVNVNNVSGAVNQVTIRNDDNLGPPNVFGDVNVRFSGLIADNGLTYAARVELEMDSGPLPAKTARIGGVSIDSQQGDVTIKELAIRLGGLVESWRMDSVDRADTLKVSGGALGFWVDEELRGFSTFDGSGLAGRSPPAGENPFGLSFKVPSEPIPPELFGVRVLPDSRPDVSTSYTGSSGADRFDTRGGYSAGDFYNGGPGTDRIVYFTPNIEGFKLPVSIGNLASIEEVEVSDAFSGTLNLKYFNTIGINSFLFSSSTADDGAEDVLNLSAATNTIAWGAGREIRDDLRIRVEFNGQADTVNFALVDTDAHEDLVFTDVETVRIGSAGGAPGAINFVGGDLAGTTFAGGGSRFFLEGATAFEIKGQFQGLSFDAGTFTGSGPVTFSTAGGSASAAGVTLTGGSGSDRLVGTANTGAANQDLIGGGAGNDQLWVSARHTGGAAQQGDTLTGGPGADLFVFRGDSLANVLALSSGTAAVVTIADFQPGTDKIALVADAAAAGFVLGGGQQVAAAADLAAVYAGIAAIAASTAATYQGAVVTVNAGAAAGAYLYVNDTVAGVSAADDMLVRIGLTGAGLTGADVALALR
ncbi:MAG: hypothetical protein AB7K86_05980 [Rhodospirillales bacterium]